MVVGSACHARYARYSSTSTAAALFDLATSKEEAAKLIKLWLPPVDVRGKLPTITKGKISDMISQWTAATAEPFISFERAGQPKPACGAGRSERSTAPLGCPGGSPVRLPSPQRSPSRPEA